MELTFNAKGTDNQNWFSDSKLTHSSQWYDIKKESKNYFSVSGDTTKKRHFFINRGYAGNCAGDTGWMVIAGKECDWERRGHKHKNPILYSKLSTYTKWEEKSELTNTLCFYDFNSASEMLLFFPFWREVALNSKKSKTTKRNRVDNWNIIILIGRAKKSFPLVGKSEGGGGGGGDVGDYIWG